MPQLLTNACIQKGPAWLGKPAEWAGCGLINCGGCGEGTVGDAVLDYQKRGKRVIISVGGQNADATNMDPDKGRALPTPSGTCTSAAAASPTAAAT